MTDAINEIINSGSTKEKIQLLVEDIALSRNFRNVLSVKQQNDIYSSLTQKDIIELENLLTFEQVLSSAASNLYNLVLAIEKEKAQSFSLILAWNIIENAELLANTILHEIESSERIKIAEKILKIDLQSLYGLGRDEEGYLELAINSNPFISVKQHFEDHVTPLIRRFLAWSKATEDFIEERRIDIPAHIETIKTYTQLVCRMYFPPISGIKKYEHNSKEQLKQKYTSKQAKLIEKYQVIADVKTLKLDLEQYNWFKNFILSNERGKK